MSVTTVSLKVTLLTLIVVSGSLILKHHHHLVNYVARSEISQARILYLGYTPKRTDEEITATEETVTDIPVGRIPANQSAPSWENLEAQYVARLSGGQCKPPECTARDRVAIVVPYKDRDHNLRVFLQHMHPFLQRQQLDYRIYVIEPNLINGSLGFNRGMMKNIGFVEAARRDGYDCVIFHDVDLLPESDKNRYCCHPEPHHLCVSVDYYDYIPLNGGAIFGGIVSFSSDVFSWVNGYSNLYFGWGAEDDDLLGRCHGRHIEIRRPSAEVGRYKGTPHERHQSDRSRRNFNRRLWRIGKRRSGLEGLNNLEYVVAKREERSLFTWILVEYNEDTYLRRIEFYLNATAPAVSHSNGSSLLAG